MKLSLKNNKSIFFVLFILTCCFTAAKVKAQTTDEKKVGEAVESLRVAMVKADTVQLKNITDDGLSYGHSSGKIQNKTEFVSSIATGASVFVTLDFTEQTIKVIGNTAIVRHILTAKTNDSGKPGAVHLGILLIFEKEHGNWKLIARQAVKV